MLTQNERQTIREKCKSLSLKGLDDLMAHCASEGRQDAVQFVHQLIIERKAEAVPFEISGHFRERQAWNTTGIRKRKTEIVVPGITANQVKTAALWVGGFSAVAMIVSAIAFVIIPAIVSAASAFAAFIGGIIGYLIAGAVALAFLSSIVGDVFKGGQKKTTNPHYPQSGGQVYNVNINIGPNGDIRVNQ